jgi:hypothetical protein
MADATVTGGQFLFSLPSGSGFNGTLVAINDGTNPLSPLPIPGDLNIEVFTSLAIGDTLPALDAGFQAGLIDPGGTIANGFLIGTTLELFGGDYEVTDSLTGSNTPAEILLGSGNQSVVGADGDTLVGGSGTQLLEPNLQILGHIPGPETTVGGTGSYTIIGSGQGGSIAASPNSTAATSGNIVIQPFVAFVVPSAGNYTIASGTFDTVKALTGSANVTVTDVYESIINLVGNSGNELIITSSFGVITQDTIIAGAGDATVMGSGDDSIVGGSGGQQLLEGSTIIGGLGGIRHDLRRRRGYRQRRGPPHDPGRRTERCYRPLAVDRHCGHRCAGFPRARQSDHARRRPGNRVRWQR